MPVWFGVPRRVAPAASVLVLGSLVLMGSARPVSAQDPVPRRPLGREVPVHLPAAGDPERRDGPPVQNPTGPVTLGEAGALALLQNPRLAAVGWEIRAREARLLQAGTRLNPSVSVLVEDIGSRTPDRIAGQPVDPQTTIQLGQVLELGGKRAAREKLAALDRDLAAWDYETARIDVLTETSQAFTDVLAAQEMLAVTEETTRTVEQVQQSVGARVEAGVVSPIEATRATVSLASAQVEVARARRTLEATRTRLALLWGASAPAFTAATGDLKGPLAPLPPIGDLTARLAQNPTLARWPAERSFREAALSVELSRRIPDVSVSAGYRRFSDIDSHAFVIGASIPLPLFDRNRGGIEEARSRLARGHEERRAAEGRVHAALAGSYAELASAHDEVTALRSTVLPGSQETFDAVSEGYRLGKFGLLDVLDAQRTLIAAGRQYVEALTDYYKAAAAVERLIGDSLNRGPSVSKE